MKNKLYAAEICKWQKETMEYAVFLKSINAKLEELYNITSSLI